MCCCKRRTPHLWLEALRTDVYGLPSLSAAPASRKSTRSTVRDGHGFCVRRSGPMDFHVLHPRSRVCAIIEVINELSFTTWSLATSTCCRAAPNRRWQRSRPCPNQGRVVFNCYVLMQMRAGGNHALSHKETRPHLIRPCERVERRPFAGVSELNKVEYRFASLHALKTFLNARLPLGAA